MTNFRTKIQPLCNRHYVPMTAATLTTVSGTREFYRCPEAGCSQHFDVTNGYGDLVGDKLVVHAMQICCGRDGKAMYLSSLDPETGTQLWLCPCLNCEQSQQICCEEFEACPSYELLGE